MDSLAHPLPIPFRKGETIDGKFRVERVLGTGGAAVVLLATHLKLDERVALKLLRLDRLLDPGLEARFLQEARATAKIKSEYVARVYDVGVTDQHQPYMVLEYLEGMDLKRVLDQEGALSLNVAVEYIVQMCDGLAEAHARGIVHRDLKPENVIRMVGADGWTSVKIVDFGIAKVLSTMSDFLGARVQAANTTVDNMGTPLYMSPEQLRSTASVDHRTDVWSLGALLFELVSTTHPFQGEDFPSLIAQIMHEEPARLLPYCPTAPPLLQTVVDKCLQKDPANRYQNAAELALALLPIAPRRAHVAIERSLAITRAAGLLSDSSLRLPRSVPPAASPREDSSSRVDSGLAAEGARSSTPTLDAVRPASSTTRDAVSTTTPQPATASSSRVPWVVGGLGVLGLLGAGFLFARSGQKPTQRAEASSFTQVSAMQPAPSVSALPLPVLSGSEPAAATVSASADSPLASASSSSPATTPPTRPVRKSAPSPPATSPPSPSPTLQINRER